MERGAIVETYVPEYYINNSQLAIAEHRVTQSVCALRADKTTQAAAVTSACALVEMAGLEPASE